MNKKFANRSSYEPTNRVTLRRELLEVAGRTPDLMQVLRDAQVDAERKALIAERVRHLRERSPYTQQVIADKLHITLRGYQKIEAEGGARFERLEELAKIHGVDVGYFYETNDAAEQSQLDRIEALLVSIAAHLGVNEPKSGGLEKPPGPPEVVGGAEKKPRRAKRAS